MSSCAPPCPLPVLLGFLLVVSPACSGSPAPPVVALGSSAQITLLPGQRFLGRETALQFLAAQGNACHGHEFGLILGPEASAGFVVVEYLDVGYVPEPPEGFLDPAPFLAGLRRQTRSSNPPVPASSPHDLTIEGWEEAPRYDALARTVEWVARARVGQRPFACRTASRLGREGVFQFTLVAPGPGGTLAERFPDLVGGLHFLPGHRHEDARPGDRLAAGGLEALVRRLGTADSSAAAPRPRRFPDRRLLRSDVGLGVLLGVAGLAAGFLLGCCHRRSRLVLPSTGLTGARRRHQRRCHADVYYFALTRDLLRTRR